MNEKNCKKKLKNKFVIHIKFYQNSKIIFNFNIFSLYFLIIKLYY